MKKKGLFSRRAFVKGGLATSFSPAVAAIARPLRKLASLDQGDSLDPLPDLGVIALNRLTFGPRPEDFGKFKKLGKTDIRRLQAFVEMQLEPGRLGGDSICEGKVKEAGLSTLNKNFTQLWADHVVAADVLRETEKEKISSMADSGDTPRPGLAKTELAKIEKGNENQLRLEPITQLENATWIRAIYSDRQLFEVLVNFWHDHFSIFGWEGKISPLFIHYDRDVIRKHALGNFREMLEDVARSPAMLVYLDNALNQSGNPNENYARELFELHTLGAENYLGTQDRKTVAGFGTGQSIGYVDGDVYEAARGFTGWRLDQGKDSKNTGQFDYFEQWHDRFQKIVLGHPLVEYQPPLKDGKDILDLLTKHPGTARYVCRKLCRRLVSNNPSNTLVEKAANVFRENLKAHDQLKQVVKTIIFSNEFRNSWGHKIKRPFEFTVGLLRATGADFSFSDPFKNNFEKTGQRLFQWRTPDGYPDFHEKWANTNSLLERWRLTDQIFLGGLPGIKIDADLIRQNIKGMSPENLISYWGHQYLGREVSIETFNAIITFLKDDKIGGKKVAGALALLFMSPDFQWS